MNTKLLARMFVVITISLSLMIPSVVEAKCYKGKARHYYCDDGTVLSGKFIRSKKDHGFIYHWATKTIYECGEITGDDWVRIGPNAYRCEWYY